MLTSHQRQRMHAKDSDTQPREVGAADLVQHWPPRRAVPNCAGPCDQGRKLCPCPTACLAPDDEPAPRWQSLGVWLVLGVIGGLAFWAAVVSFLLALR